MEREDVDAEQLIEAMIAAGTALLSISGPVGDTAEQALVRGAILMFESGANNEAVPEAGRTDFDPDGFGPKPVTEALRVMR